MNFIGLLLGIITLLIIGLGFPLVIYGERLFGYTAWPYMMSIGIIVISTSLLLSTSLLSAIAGVLGATFVWGATELKEQAIRAEIGWYPHNPHKIRLPFTEIIKKWKAPHL